MAKHTTSEAEGVLWVMKRPKGVLSKGLSALSYGAKQLEAEHAA